MTAFAIRDRRTPARELETLPGKIERDPLAKLERWEALEGKAG